MSLHNYWLYPPTPTHACHMLFIKDSNSCHFLLTKTKITLWFPRHFWSLELSQFQNPRYIPSKEKLLSCLLHCITSIFFSVTILECLCFFSIRSCWPLTLCLLWFLTSMPSMFVDFGEESPFHFLTAVITSTCGIISIIFFYISGWMYCLPINRQYIWSSYWRNKRMVSKKPCFKGPYTCFEETVCVPCENRWWKHLY